jgi:glyoxylase-like metal-dependent hydrolase (beta-lactamase superfamily II)
VRGRERRRHGSDRYLEDCRDAAVIEVGVVAEKHDEPLSLRKLCDEGRDRLEPRRRWVGEGIHTTLDRARSSVSNGASRSVDHGAPEPGVHRAVAAERCAGANRIRERVVHDLLCQAPVADDRVRNPHETQQVATVCPLDLAKNTIHLRRLIHNEPALLSAEQISEHVWWMKPGPPDRPSLCAVVGERWTLALDAGSSRAHTRQFLDRLPARPSAVVYTHSHWDHVFGGVEIGGLVIAHTLTAEKLVEKAARDWTDDANVNENVRTELPAPRVVEIAQADVTFDEGLVFELGGVRVHARHVGGAHAADSSVMFVEPDGVLFLGDALCDAVDERLEHAVLAFDAQRYVEGHHPAVSTRAEIEALIAEQRDLH